MQGIIDENGQVNITLTANLSRELSPLESCYEMVSELLPNMEHDGIREILHSWLMRWNENVTL